MANNEGVYVFPDAMTKASGIDPNLLALLNSNGGFGNNGYWIWILFMWMIWGGNGNWGNGFGGNNGMLANQLFNTEGRDMLLQAINGRADALGQLANITNTSVETVKNGIFALQNAINQTSNQVGMSGLQTINAIQAGDASIASQICQCCCENRLAIANQTAALQAQLAQNDANVRLQLAQLDGSDKLAVCQQTNTLQNQAERDTTSILNAINSQNAMIVKEFCDLKERELQNKINTQGDIITQLRNQISNDEQTLKFNSAFHALDDKIDAIAAKQPNTTPVVWPNLTAVNNTPYAGGMYYGNGFGNIVF
jgi:hypothetical protein